VQPLSFDSGACELSYSEGPDAGPPVVLLHGFARCWQDFGPILAALDPWHIHALDFRGHGASGRTPGAYRVVDYVGDAVALLERRIARPALLIGHSLGAMVAAAVAAERPELVRAVILEDPPFAMMGRRIAETAYLGLFRAYRDLLAATDSEESLAAGLAEVILDSQGGDPPVRLGAVRDAKALRFLASCLRRLDPEALAPIVAGRWLDGFDVEGCLSRVACPALFLQADFAAGGALPDDYAATLAGMLPRGRHVRLAEVGHQIHATVPEAMMTYTADFLDSLDWDLDRNHRP